MALILLILGIITLAFITIVVREWLNTRDLVVDERRKKTIVPVNLVDNDNGIILADRRGRITYINEKARNWFGMNGSEPNLAIMATMVQPSAIFYEVFAAEGQAVFRLGNRQLEAESHYIPTDNGRQMVVVLREAVYDKSKSNGYDPIVALNTVSDISAMLGRETDLQETLEEILARIGTVLTFDASEITIWDEANQSLRPVSYTGDMAYSDELAQAGGVYAADEGISGWIARYRQPIVISDIAERQDVTPKLETPSFKSFLGVPLQVGERFVGTLELANRQKNGFDHHALSLLESLSSHVAIVLENSRLYRDQSSRLAELSGLKKIAGAMSTLDDPRAMYREIHASLAELMDVDICGILLLDEAEQTLVGQTPMHGLQDVLASLVRFSVKDGTVGHSIWMKDNGWYTNNAATKDEITTLELTGVVDVNQLRSVGFMPLMIGDHRAGAIMIANTRDSELFTDKLMDSLNVFAAEVAIVVENARLFHQEQRRKAELEGLQRIASAMGNLHDLNELHSQLTAEIARLMGADICGLWMVDEIGEKLVAQPPFFGLDDEELAVGQLKIDDELLLETVWNESEYLIINNPDQQVERLSKMGLLVNQFGLKRSLFARLEFGSQKIGLIQIVNTDAEATPYNIVDAEELFLFARQAAVLIDNAKLYASARYRAIEADNLRKISEQLSNVLSIDEVIQSVFADASALLDCAGISMGLLDTEAGKLTFDANHVYGFDITKPIYLDIFEQGFSQSVALSRNSFLSNDIANDKRVLPAYATIVKQFKLRSALIVPLVMQGRSMGELSALNKSDHSFTDADEELLKTVASQIAAAMERASLYQSTDADLRARVEELNAIDRIGRELAGSLEYDHILEVTRSEIVRTTGEDGVSVALITPPSQWIDPDVPMLSRRVGGSSELADDFIHVEIRALESGQVVFIQDYLGSDLEAIPEGTRSAVIEPMMSGQNEPLGLIHVYSPNTNTFAEINREFLSQVARQAALAIGNARRYQEQVSLNEMLRVHTAQMTEIYNIGKMIRQGAGLQEILDNLTHVLAANIKFRKVLIRLVDDDGEFVRPIASHGLDDNELQLLRESPRRLEDVASTFDERWRMGTHTYFLPAEYEEEWNPTPTGGLLGQIGQRRWQAADAFVGALRKSNGELIGWISVDDPINGRRPDDQTAESLDIFAAETSFSIENYQTLRSIQTEAESVRAERDRLSMLHFVAGDIQRTPDMHSRLQAMLNGIQLAGWNKVRFTMRDENLDNTMLVHSGYSSDEVVRINAQLLPGSVWQQRFNDPEFEALKIGSSYYMRYDEPWVQKNVFQNRKPTPESVGENEWHPQDRIYLPLKGSNENRVIGILVLEDPLNGLVPTTEDLQPIELFAIQAAGSIESTRLYMDTMMQKETEQRVAELMESVAASLDMENVLLSLADGLQQMVPFTRMHVALPAPSDREFVLRRVEVTSDRRAHIFDDESILMEGSAMEEIYRQNKREVYRLSQANVIKDRPDLQLWQSQGERITMMVPMITGGETLGVLRLGSELEDAFGFDENLDVVSRMANLSAVSISHSRLVNELVSSKAYSDAVVESIQQGIVVLDNEHNISTLNVFVKARYGWSDESIGKSLYAIEPDFEIFLRHSITTALEEGTPQHQFEVQDFDKDGNRLIRNFYTYPLKQGKDITGVVLLIEDVTERAMLESDLALRAEQLAALTRVSSQITSTLASDQVVNVVLEALESVMPYDGVTLWLREDEQLRVLAARGYRDPGTESPEKLVGLYVDISAAPLFDSMAQEQKIVNVGDTGNDARFPYGAERVYRNWLGAPLISQSEIIGVIALEKKEVNYYDVQDEQLLQNFANQASIALRNAQLFEQTISRTVELDAQTRRLELLNRVAVALAQSLDIENIFETTLRETAIALEIHEAAALKIDHEHELGRVVVEYPRGDYEPDQVFNLSNNEVFRRVRDSLSSFVVDDIQNDPLGKHVLEWFREDNVTAVLFVPLVVGGTMIGLMHFDATSKYYQFTQERLEIAQTLASQAAIAVQNASLFEQSVMRTHELETLFEASQATAVTLDLDEAMRRVVSQMLSALRADYCTISLWDEVEATLVVRETVSAWGEQDRAATTGMVHNLDDFPIREQALRQREVITLRLDKDVHPSEKAVMEDSGAKDRLLVPLVVNEYSIGLIDLEIREQNRFFESGDIRLARTLASQSAVAIENARLQTETRAQIEELYIINDLSRAVSSKTDVDDLFPMITEQLPVLTDADILYVALYDTKDERITFPIAEHTTDGRISMLPIALGEDEFSYIVRRNSPLLLAGSKMMEARDSYGIDTVLPNVKCFLGVPMLAGDDVVGVLAVQDNHDPRAFGVNDQRILTTIASQLGVAIQNARLFQQTSQFAEELEGAVTERTIELETERERMQTLYDITTETSASLDINRVLSRALDRLAQAIGATSGVILGIDEVSEQVYVLHSTGNIPTQPAGERRKLQQDKGLAGWVLENHQSVVIPDVQDDDRWLVRDERDTAQRSVVAALLEVGEDSRGVIMLFSEIPRAFNEGHLKLVTAAASQLANSMNNAELYSLIRDQAERLGAILREEQRESTKNTAILDSVADGVMYANEHGTVVSFNTAAERILGLPAARVVNRSITELTGLYGGSSGVWMESMERWMADPSSHEDEDFVEELLELDDSRVISVRLSPVNMGDQFLGTVSVFRDITRMIEVDRMKSEFVSTVSHELRTPMTSIKGYADLLLLGAAGDVTEAQQRFLETIKQNADRLSILVNDLLEVSRIDQDKVPMKFAAVDVADLLDKIEAHLSGLAEDNGRDLSIQSDIAEALPAIRADGDRIIQIMQNLADNALNYTHDGGTITIRAKLDQERDAVTMSISDTGVGIPENIQHRVFERFFRGDDYDDRVLDTPGTGLGLSIVKSLVEMHGGEIWLESAQGEGTTFFVSIPTIKEDVLAEELE